MKRPTSRLHVLLFFAVIVALAPIPAQAAILIVTNTQDPGTDSFRSLVATASAGDTIKFDIPTSDAAYNVETGVFTITLTAGEIVIDKDLTITGPPAANVAISSNHVSRLFNVTSGTVSISNLFLVNGTARGADGSSSFGGDPGLPGIGGAILNQATLNLTRCTFMQNAAVGGTGGHGSVNPGGNGGDGRGGAIANQNTLSLVACTLAANSATGGMAGLGGGEIESSAAGGIGSGGAIYNAAAANLALTNCTVTDNTATGADVLATIFGPGGATAQGGGVANLGTVTIVHSTLANNTAMGGNSTGSGPHNGGASFGGGLYDGTGSDSSTRDTIFAPNSAVGGAGSHTGIAIGPDVNGAVTSLGHNLLGRSDGCTGFATDDQQGGTTDDTRLDPKLGTLGNQGGPTDTLPLLAESPAIDGADTAAPARDQRNFVRAGQPDIGAFEYQGTEPILLANISTRLRVQTGDNAMIGGLIITGTERKTVIIRGIGPSLPVVGALADPVIEVHASSGELITTNDNWRDGVFHSQVASSLPPASDLESALWGILDPGAYTVVVRGKNDAIGIGLVEVYDLDQTVDSKVANLSTRGFVDTGENVMIGGTIITGNAPTRVLFRAIGPSLTNFGVPHALENPTLELYDGNGQVIAMNNDWRDTQEAEIIATGIPPSNDLESAIVQTLAAGNYTAIVRGAGDTTGIALIEIYNLN